MKNNIKISLIPIFMFGLISCVNPNIGHMSTKNISKENEPYSIDKHYVSSSVKYLDQKELDNEGKPLPIALSGFKGRFYFEDGCLKYVSELASEEATPIFNYNLVKWDSDSQTLLINKNSVSMGQLVEGSGEFDNTPKNIKGKCWGKNIIYISSIGVKVLEK